MTLPKQVLLPPESVALAHGEHSYHYEAWRYILGTLRALPEIAVDFDARLGMPCWSAYELSVDGVPVAIDISDYALVDPAVGAFKHWLRFTYTPMFAPFANIGAFPITSFLDWNEYASLAAELAYDATGRRIVFGQNDAAGENLPSRKTERRQYVRRVLQERYPEALDDAWTDRQKVEWCRQHRDVCRQIGRQAKEFFAANSGPRAIWSYVQRRLSSIENS